jgi:hypothetical protein
MTVCKHENIVVYYDNTNPNKQMKGKTWPPSTALKWRWDSSLSSREKWKSESSEYLNLFYDRLFSVSFSLFLKNRSISRYVLGMCLFPRFVHTKTWTSRTYEVRIVLQVIAYFMQDAEHWRITIAFPNTLIRTLWWLLFLRCDAMFFLLRLHLTL